MAVENPTILGQTYATPVTGTAITLTKPSGVTPTDLLLIIVASADTGTTGWNEVSGWNLIINVGTGTSDSDLGVYWRLADGSEGADQEITRTSSENCHGWYLRVGPVNQSTPINIVGTVTIQSGSSINALAVTTTEDHCLAFACFGFDGSDSTWTITGTGWNEVDDKQTSTGTGGVSSAFAIKDMDAQGPTDNCLGTNLSTDGELAIQFAVMGGEPPQEYKVEGITKDKDGTALGSCHTFLCKDNGDNTCSFIAYVLSNVITGAYSFAGLYNNDPAYFVISWKDDTPHVFDVTDHVLQPMVV